MESIFSRKRIQAITAVMRGSVATTSVFADAVDFARPQYCARGERKKVVEPTNKNQGKKRSERILFTCVGKAEIFFANPGTERIANVRNAPE